MIKLHGHGSLERVNLSLWFLRVQVHNVKDSIELYGDWSRKWKLRAVLSSWTENRKQRKVERAYGFWNLTACPQEHTSSSSKVHTSQTYPHSVTNWEPSISTSKFMEDILLKNISKEIFFTFKRFILFLTIIYARAFIWVLVPRETREHDPPGARVTSNCKPLSMKLVLL